MVRGHLGKNAIAGRSTSGVYWTDTNGKLRAYNGLGGCWGALPNLPNYDGLVLDVVVTKLQSSTGQFTLFARSANWTFYQLQWNGSSYWTRISTFVGLSLGVEGTTPGATDYTGGQRCQNGCSGTSVYLFSNGAFQKDGSWGGGAISQFGYVPTTSAGIFGEVVTSDGALWVKRY